MSSNDLEKKFSDENTIRIEYARRLPIYEKMKSRIEAEIIDALESCEHIDRISVRIKTSDSFSTKSKKYQNPFLEIEDQIAARIIVFFLSDIEIVRKKLIARFNCVEDKFKHPTADDVFGYESHHVVCIILPNLYFQTWGADFPTTFELQIRTLLMHAWAEPQHDLAYKGVSKPDGQSNKSLAWIAASCWGADQEYERLRTKLKEGLN